MKKILSVVLILALALSLVACTTANTDLYDASKNMQEVKAIETNTDISFNLSGQGLGTVETTELKQVAMVVNSMKLNIKDKSIENEEGTSARAESEINIDFMGMNIPLKGWSEIDLDKSEMVMISKLPEIFLGLIGTPIESDGDNPLEGKEYIVNDISSMMKAEGQDLDLEEMLEFQKEFQPKLIKFMEEIEKDLKLDTRIIKVEEEGEIDGEKVKVYRLKLNDESLREVVKGTVNYVLENKTSREFVLEYMDEYIDTMKKMSMQDELSQSDLKELEERLDDFESDLDGNLDKVKRDFNLFMDKYKDIRILGEEGINILYSVNRDGYVVEKDGIIDLRIDLAQLAQFKEEKNQEESMFSDTEMKGIVNLKITFKSNNTNINNEELTVEWPELTRENSLNMDELMEIQMQMIEELEDMPIEE